jgi:hypothetical protein
MTVRSVCLILVFTIAGFSVIGQQTDYGFWSGGTIGYQHTKRLSFEVEGQGRFGQGFSRYNTGLVDVSGRYALNDYLKATVTYRFAHRLRYDDREDLRQRLNTDLQLRLKEGRMKYSFRLRYQAGRRNTDERNADLREALRFKAKAATKIARKTEGSIAGELFFSDRTGSYQWSDWRCKAMINRKLNKRSNLDFGYLIQREVNRRNPLLEHMLVVGYNYSFKRPKKKKDSSAQ